MNTNLSPVAYSTLLALIENETDSEWNSNFRSYVGDAAEECGEEADASLIADELNKWASTLR